MLLHLVYWLDQEVKVKIGFFHNPGRLSVRLEVWPKAIAFDPPRLDHLFEKPAFQLATPTVKEEVNGQEVYYHECFYPQVVWPRNYRVVWPGRTGRIIIFGDGRLQAWDGPKPLLEEDGVWLTHAPDAPTLWERLNLPFD